MLSAIDCLSSADKKTVLAEMTSMRARKQHRAGRTVERHARATLENVSSSKLCHKPRRLQGGRHIVCLGTAPGQCKVRYRKVLLTYEL